MATVGVSLGCRGGTMRGLGGGVELRRTGSRVALGRTAARPGDDAGSASLPLGDGRRAGGRKESLALAARGSVGSFAEELIDAELASPAALPIQGYFDAAVLDGNVGGGIDERPTLGNAMPGGNERGNAGGGSTCCDERAIASGRASAGASEISSAGSLVGRGSTGRGATLVRAVAAVRNAAKSGIKLVERTGALGIVGEGNSGGGNCGRDGKFAGGCDGKFAGGRDDS